jgi:2,3-bisphosphoglycerate-independent phosphoglycerate mutase
MTSCPKLVRAAHAGVPGPVVVVVMDGVGVGRGDAADAVAHARTPTLDRLRATYPYLQLAAHGPAVGMPNDDDMGNSEVGHNAIGAGRIFDQGAKRVAEAVQSGSLFTGATWQKMMGQLQHQNGALHLIGLLSDGNVHSHIEHVLALIARADADNIRRLFVHVMLDGRDVPKTSALVYLDRLEAALQAVRAKGHRQYHVASGGGRMHTTMDRYQADWPMVERGWQLHVRGQGRGFASARQAVETFRAEQSGIGDQDLPGFVVHEGGRPIGPIVDGDAVITFNFRGDRMLELVQAFEDDTFAPFDRGVRPKVLFAGMTLYDGDAHRPRQYLVEPPHIRCTLGELLCEAGITQLACSETQKFGHVTYFWNGNRSGKFDNKLETYTEIKSWPAPFDARPQMKAFEINEAVRRTLAAGNTRFARINFANGDMVGHTGNFEATVASVEAVDTCLQGLVQDILHMDGALIVTADHGNAEEMAERHKVTGEPLRDAAGRLVQKTSHSLNPVPCHVVMRPEQQARFALSGVERPGLGHLAATVTTLLGYQPPAGFMPPLIAPRTTA